MLTAIGKRQRCLRRVVALVFLGGGVAALAGVHPAAGPDVGRVEAGLPAELKSALRRDLGISGRQWIEQTDRAAGASAAVQSLRAEGLAVSDPVLVDGVPHAIAGTPAEARRVAATGIVASVADPTVARPARGRTASTTAQRFRTMSRTGPDRLTVTSGEVVGGIAISNGRTSCTVGLLGVDVRSKARQALTAGHCFGSGDRTRIGGLRNGVADQIEVGNVEEGSVRDDPGGTVGFGPDSELITLDPSARALPMVVHGDRQRVADSVRATNAAGPEHDGTDVYGIARPVIGMPVCANGSRSGWTCSTIIDIDLELPDSDTGTTGRANQIVTRNSMQPGDSGTALMAGHYAVAIFSGASEGDNVWTPLTGSADSVSRQHPDWQILTTRPWLEPFAETPQSTLAFRAAGFQAGEYVTVTVGGHTTLRTRASELGTIASNPITPSRSVKAQPARVIATGSVSGASNPQWARTSPGGCSRWLSLAPSAQLGWRFASLSVPRTQRPGMPSVSVEHNGSSLFTVDRRRSSAPVVDRHDDQTVFSFPAPIGFGDRITTSCPNYPTAGETRVATELIASAPTVLSRGVVRLEAAAAGAREVAVEAPTDLFNVRVVVRVNGVAVGDWTGNDGGGARSSMTSQPRGSTQVRLIVPVTRLERGDRVTLEQVSVGDSSVSAPLDESVVR